MHSDSVCLIAFSNRPLRWYMQCQSWKKPLYCDWAWKCCWVWVVLILNETCTESLMFLTPLDCLSVSRLAIWIQLLITPSSALAQCKALEGFFLTLFCFLMEICNYTCVLAVKMILGKVISFPCHQALRNSLWYFLHTSSWTLWLLLSRTFLQHALSLRRYRAFYCSLSHCELKAIKHWLMRSSSARVTSIKWRLMVCDQS